MGVRCEGWDAENKARRTGCGEEGAKDDMLGDEMGAKFPKTRGKTWKKHSPVFSKISKPRFEILEKTGEKLETNLTCDLRPRVGFARFAVFALWGLRFSRFLRFLRFSNLSRKCAKNAEFHRIAPIDGWPRFHSYLLCIIIIQ